MEAIFWSDDDDVLEEKDLPPLEEEEEGEIHQVELQKKVDQRPESREQGKDDERDEDRHEADEPEPKAKRHQIHRLSTKDKAGLSAGDDAQQARIEAVLAEHKAGRFGEQELKRAARVEVKVAKLQAKIREIRQQDSRMSTDMLAQHRVAVVERDVARAISELESTRDLTHTILCVDMDQFYLAVELIDRPDLRGKPVAVGGNSMLSTSSYEARRFGVRSAMPGFIAKKLCPDLIIIPTNFSKYAAVGEIIRKIFAEFDEHFR